MKSFWARGVPFVVDALAVDGHPVPPRNAWAHVSLLIYVYFDAPAGSSATSAIKPFFADR